MHRQVTKASTLQSRFHRYQRRRSIESFSSWNPTWIRPLDEWLVLSIQIRITRSRVEQLPVCLSVCLSADLVFFVSALSSFDHTPAQRAEFSCPAMRCSSTEFFRLMFSLFFWNQFADIIETDTHGARRPWSTHILTASGRCLTSAASALNKPHTASYRRCRCYCNLWPR